MTAALKLVKGKEAPKAVASSMETMVFTPAEIDKWVVPPFQRPLRINAKVRSLAEELKLNGGIIAGVLTLGLLPNDKTVYIVDGQHRIAAFKLSELLEGIADVRICSFDSMADMAEEFALLQQSLVRMRPDDVLRAMEGSVPAIQNIRQRCPFVGYDNVRRLATNAPVLSMAVVIRHWGGSYGETPTPAPSNSRTAAEHVKDMDHAEVDNLIKFLNVAFAAWGRDQENFKLWGGLNLGMCMWLYRRMVIDQDRRAKRSEIFTDEQFKKCLMALSAESEYIDWITGRSLADVHRLPCYRRIVRIFAKRMREDTGKDVVKFPQPAWAVSR